MRPPNESGATQGSNGASEKRTDEGNHTPTETSTPRRPRRKHADAVIGNDYLCAWQLVPGIVWVQTRNPEFARKLSRRADGRLVMRGVAGGFLRTFEFPRSLRWAAQLFVRYTLEQQVTNAAKTGAISSGKHFEATNRESAAPIPAGLRRSEVSI